MPLDAVPDQIRSILGEHLTEEGMRQWWWWRRPGRCGAWDDHRLRVVAAALETAARLNRGQGGT